MPETLPLPSAAKRMPVVARIGDEPLVRLSDALAFSEKRRENLRCAAKYDRVLRRRAEAALSALREDAERMRKDAERYRWLRSAESVNKDGPHVYGPDDDCILEGDDCDAAIDVARAAIDGPGQRGGEGRPTWGSSTRT